MNPQDLIEQNLERIQKNISECLPYLEQNVEDFSCGRLITKQDPSEKLARYQRLNQDKNYLISELTEWLNGLPMLIATGQTQKAIQKLENGADPNAISKVSYLDIASCFVPDILHTAANFEYPPLHIAAILRDTESFESALDYGARPYDGIIKDTKFQRAPIASETCARYGFLNGLIALEDRGYDLWPLDDEMKENLLLDCLNEHGNAETFDHLYDRLGITDIDFTFQGARNIADGLTLLYSSQHFTPIEIVESILKKGADLNQEALIKKRRVDLADGFKEDMEQQSSGFSSQFQAAQALNGLYSTLPLIKASYHGDVERVKLYLQYGADPTLRDSNGHTAMDAINDTRRPEIHKRNPHDLAEVKRLVQSAVEDKMGANVTLFAPAKPDLDID